MLKKFFAVTFVLMIFAAQTCAMTFTAPEQIGTVSAGGQFGLKIDGETRIDAELKQNVFTKGTAIFGDKLYLYFDAAQAVEFNAGSRFGSSDEQNTVACHVFEGRTEIFRLKNDAGLELYLLATETDGGGSMTVIGERDGTWVKFFNTNEAKSMFGLTQNFYLKDFSATGDTLNLTCEDSETREYFTLSYRWDESAQWFGVEKI